MSSILKARHVNWGLCTSEDWSRTTYDLKQSGELRVRVYCGRLVADRKVAVEGDDLAELKSILSALPDYEPEIVPDACDGSAWEFHAFGDDGKEAYRFKLGYIYGLGPLERIGEILQTYEPAAAV